MSDGLLWLTERDVVDLVTLDEAIEALERLASDELAFNVPKALGSYDDGSALQALGSVASGLGYAGFKTWNYTKRGGGAIFSLFDTKRGTLAAVIEAGALGQMRTAAMTGLGTRWQAPAAADDMAIVGTGNQALAQVAAVNAVRPLKRVRVFSPTEDKRKAFADLLRRSFHAEVMVGSTLEEALDGAPIVTLITRAREPFLAVSMLARGAHLNAVGAILPTHAEFHPDVFSRIGSIVVDDIVNVQKASRELIEHFDVTGDWRNVRSIGDVIRSGRPARPEGCDLTLFKSVGMGLSDLAVAKMAYERALERGFGRSLPAQTRAAPKWKDAREAV